MARIQGLASLVLSHGAGSVEIWPSAPIDWIGLGVALGGFACGAFIFWRYPDFRRAFLEYWRSENVAGRINAWVERNKRP